jgi:D-glycero-D-manno-heptose 1,7-bisphosphate phosphatase
MVDTGYPSKPEQVLLLAGVKEGLTSLRSAGFKLVIITNQSGIGRGILGEDDFWAVQARLESLLGQDQITATYFCPDHPDKPSERRKPAPGMLLQAARDLDLDLTASFMIGDKESDIQAGLNAGVKAAIWLSHGTHSRFAGRENVWVVPDMATAVSLILKADRTRARG